MLRWRSRCRAGDDGDHNGALEVEIKGTRWWWPYHVRYFWLHVMFIFYASYFAQYDGSFIRWSLTKFQGTGVLPEYAPLPKFVVPRHHVMIGCDKLYFHIQRVQASFAHAEMLGLNLTSLAYADMASEHWDRKVERESYSRYDQHSDVYHWKLLHLTWWLDMG